MSRRPKTKPQVLDPPKAEANYLDLSSLNRLIAQELSIAQILDTQHKIGEYSLKDIMDALLRPTSAGETVINTSAYLYRMSPHYRRLCSYIANLASFDFLLDVYDVRGDKPSMEKLHQHYSDVAALLDRMNLKHELSKIMKVLSYQDVYYGVLCESGSDFFIQQLPVTMCRIQSIQDGLYNFKINLSAIDPLKINAFPDYIQQAYIDYRNGTPGAQLWYMPPGDKQICLKLNSEVPYPMPLFLPIVRDIFDLSTYKDLKLQGARVDNYKAIIISIPIDDKSVDKPLLTPNTIAAFAQMNRANMSDDIGLLHTPGKAEAISFKESTNSRNNVEDCVDDVYNSSGVSKELFNGSSSGTALTFSIENDSGFVYAIYRQIEAWFSRFFKLRKINKPSYKFFLRFVDSTTLNRQTVIDRYFKMAQSGAPVRRDIMSLLGYTPSRAIGADLLESQVLPWASSWVPLLSSHTQGSDGEGGRPESNNLTNEGEKTRDTESNSKR